MRYVSQDGSQNGAKLGILGAMLANIGASWRHLGSHLRSSWLQEASKWSPEGEFFRVMSQLRARGSKMIPKCSQNAPQIIPK